MIRLIFGPWLRRRRIREAIKLAYGRRLLCEGDPRKRTVLLGYLARLG